MFALAEPDASRGARRRGFTDIRVEALDLRFTYPSFEAWWQLSRDLGRPLAELVDAWSQTSATSCSRPSRSASPRSPPPRRAGRPRPARRGRGKRVASVR
jgi:hypothetical protein